MYKLSIFKFQKQLKEKMDLNNGAKLLYSNFGNLQKSNSENLPEVSDYFDSNPATPVKDIPATTVKDIGAPIKDTPMVTVPMNLCDILETIDVVSTNIEENQSKQLGEGDTEGEDAIYNVKRLLISSLFQGFSRG